MGARNSVEIFVDSSAFFALADQASEKGKLVQAIIVERRVPLVTTNFILAETLSLVTKRMGKFKGIEVGEKILESGIISLVYLDQPTQEEAWRTYRKYKDKDFDFIDATSFVFCQKHGIKEAVTLDHHFSQMGFRIHP